MDRRISPLRLADTLRSAYQRCGSSEEDPQGFCQIWTHEHIRTQLAEIDYKRSGSLDGIEALVKKHPDYKTGKAIAPLAPAANAERFADAGKVEKWFRRNCNDVLGRACTPSEKADVLAYLLK